MALRHQLYYARVVEHGFYQTPPTLGNQYDDDLALRDMLGRLCSAATLGEIEPHLRRLGELAATELLDKRDRYRLDEPRHMAWDAWGHRIDDVTVSESWQHFSRVAAREGLLATAYERRFGALSRVYQFALVYLFAPSTQVYTCPLAMTDGCARTLEVLAARDPKGSASAIAQRILPRLLSRDPDANMTSGQWMTERTGGSDVGLSETTAKPIEGSTNFSLHGTKWFTSAVTSDVTLTLARPVDNPQGGKGLALFFAEVRDADGKLNGITVNRLKEKLGTRHVPTAELTLDGTVATPLCGLQDGIKNIAPMLNITRTWNAVCSVAFIRRGLALARRYAIERVAFGSTLANKPLHLETLADIAAEHAAALQLTFEAVRMLGLSETENHDGHDHLLGFLQPIVKLTTAKQAVSCTSEILECFGGAGYVEDTGLPELLRDAQVLPIWEGTTNVLALEAYRAAQRGDAFTQFMARLNRCIEASSDATFAGPVEVLRGAIASLTQWWTLLTTGPNPEQAAEAWLERGARRFALTAGRAMALALLIEQAQWAKQNSNDAKHSTLAAHRFASSQIDWLAAFQGRNQSSIQPIATLADLRRLALSEVHDDMARHLK